MTFENQFTAAFRVSTPLVLVRTTDPKSAMRVMLNALGKNKEKFPILVWDVIHGLIPAVNTEASKTGHRHVIEGSSQEATIPPNDMLRMIEDAASHGLLKDSIVYMQNAHLHWRNDPSVIQAIWNLRDTNKAQGSMLVLLAVPGTTLPPELLNDVLIIDEPLPTEAELRTVVANTYKYAKVKNTPDEKTLTDATNAVIGLSGFTAEQATAMSLSTDDKGEVGTLDIPELWDRKVQIINQAPGLSVYTGDASMDNIGGVASAKEFINAVMTGENPPKVIIFIDEIEKAFAGTGTDMSGTKTELTGSMLSWMQDRKIDGIIFIGIPGVSKSELAKAAGGTHGAKVIIFDIAGMQSELVGSSGGNLRTSQAVVDAISGNTVDNSGGRVLAIATCNGIESIPPELRRRFNLGVFFFDTPDRSEKDTIWTIHRRKFGIPAGEKNPADEGWTGAEIEQCCLKARRLKWTLAKSATYIVPITVSARDRIQKTRLDADGKYLSASKPGIYRATETEVTKPGLAPPNVEGRRMKEL